MSENPVFKATDNINGGNDFRVFALDVAALPDVFLLKSDNGKDGSTVSILLSSNEIRQLRDALTMALEIKEISDLLRPVGK